MAAAKRKRRSSPQRKRDPIELPVATPAKEHIILAGADRDILLEALFNPPRPKKRLVTAFRRHRQRVS